MNEPFDPYKYADLSESEDAVEQIRELEQKLSLQQGFPVTLIAFQPDEGKD
jgi:hypothetical protein